MNLTQSFLSACTIVLLALAGCAPPPPAVSVTDSVPAVNTPQEIAQPAAPNQQLSGILSQLADMREEMKQIRNSVEELQFESDNNKRRRRDLYEDVDRRLLEIERNQRAIDSRIEMAIVAQGTANTGTVTDGSEEEEWGMVNLKTSTGVAEEPAAPVAGGSGSQATDKSPADTAPPQAGQSSAADRPETVSLDEQNAYDDALELLKQSRYQDFIVAARRFITTWPDSQLADDVWYWLAEAHYVNREFENALAGFETVVTRYADSERMPEALLKTGYVQYDIGAYDEAAGIFRDVLMRFPEHNVAVPARTRLQRIENTIQ